MLVPMHKTWDASNSDILMRIGEVLALSEKVNVLELKKKEKRKKNSRILGLLSNMGRTNLIFLA